MDTIHLSDSEPDEGMEFKSAGTSIIDPRIALELEDEREMLDRRLNDITGESSGNLSTSSGTFSNMQPCNVCGWIVQSNE